MVPFEYYAWPAARAQWYDSHGNTSAACTGAYTASLEAQTLSPATAQCVITAVLTSLISSALVIAARVSGIQTFDRSAARSAPPERRQRRKAIVITDSISEAMHRSH